MTYKQLLIHRYYSARHDENPRDPLDYMAMRNLDALRAWRRRRLAQADQTPHRHESAWLRHSRWSHHVT